MTFRSFRLRVLVLLGMSLFAAASLAGIDLSERIPLLSQRIAAAPTDQSLYLRRALVYSDIGEFKLALADVDTAAQFGPAENTYFVRAVLLYRLGQLEQALPLLDRFLKSNPDHTEALMYRARVLRDAGRAEAALADYRRYFALLPDTQPGDYLTAARLMVQLADQGRSQNGRRYRRSDAVAFLDARIRQLGDAPQLQRYAIEIEQQACHSSAVIERLQQLHANARRAPQWHLQLAEQQLLTGQAEAARQSLAAAQTLLDERRPSADKAQLQQRHAFLEAVLALPVAQRNDRVRLQTLYRQHYPKAVSTTATPRGASDAAALQPQAARPVHSHTPLTGFDQPRLVDQMPEAASSEAVQVFTHCLRKLTPGRP